MIRFFRINDPYRLLAILLMLLIISLPFFIDPPSLTVHELKDWLLGEALSNNKTMYIQLLDDTPPLMASVDGLLMSIFGRWAGGWRIIAFLLVFLQAAYFDIMLISNKAYSDNTYVPALVYAVLMVFSFDTLTLSATLLGSTCLLFTISYLYQEIEFRVQRDETLLGIGITLGVASLFVFAYVAFVPAVIFIMLIFARANLRKLLLVLVAFLLPHAALFVGYVFRDGVAALWQHYYLPNFTFISQPLINAQSMFLLGLFPVGYFFFSLVLLNRVARFTRYQAQLLQMMFIWLVPCVFVVLLTPHLAPHTFIVFVPSLAYFIAHYLLLIRRRWIAETMFACLVIGVVVINLLSRYGTLDKVDYSKMFVRETATVKGKKVMCLDEGMAVYKSNQMAGYFLSWRLSEPVLSQPDYYEHVILVARALREDKPHIIIDPHQYMPPFLSRLPDVARHYRQEGETYIRISN